MDIERLLAMAERGELPTATDACEICRRTRAALCEEKTILQIELPITIVGDLHGQFADLKELFRVGGAVQRLENRYLFLGDYVDRGAKSVETLLYLFLLRLKFPDNVFLLRGNHESRYITRTYGFYDECVRKFGSASVWLAATDAFDALPLAAVIDKTAFCVHGGLSPDLPTIDSMREIKRVAEIPKNGPVSDLMWSDPVETKGWKMSPRGAGYLFGPNTVDHFNEINEVKWVIRSHQLVMEGIRWMFNQKLLCVWSAPNYCNRCGNRAAVSTIDEHGNTRFRVFDAVMQDPFKVFPFGNAGMKAISAFDDDDLRVVEDFDDAENIYDFQGEFDYLTRLCQGPTAAEQKVDYLFPDDSPSIGERVVPDYFL